MEMKQIKFPLFIAVNDKVHSFNNVQELYDFYYKVEPNYLTQFSRPFWKMGIDLTDLVHFPEKYNIQTA